MKYSLLLLLAFKAFAVAPGDCIAKPCSASTNFSEDIIGQADTRPDTWGTAGAISKRIPFHPPLGYRVRILRVYGDFLVWPRCLVVPGTTAGALWGLQTTAPDTSDKADWSADNTFVYVQTATNGAPARIPVDFSVKDGGLLEADNLLVSKIAIWLNDTGCCVHAEATWVMVFQYEKIRENIRE